MSLVGLLVDQDEERISELEDIRKTKTKPKKTPPNLKAKRKNKTKAEIKKKTNRVEYTKFTSWEYQKEKKEREEIHKQ